MTNPALGAEQANRLQTARNGAGMSYRQLAAASGIPEATLRRKLTLRPDLLTIQEISLLCDATGADFTTTVAA